MKIDDDIPNLVPIQLASLKRLLLLIPKIAPGLGSRAVGVLRLAGTPAHGHGACVGNALVPTGSSPVRDRDWAVSALKEDYAVMLFRELPRVRLFSASM